MLKKFALTFIIILSIVFSIWAEETQKVSFKKPTVIGQVTRMNINRIDMALENNGNVGLDADTYYPSGTRTSFLFAAGLACSGYVNGDLRTAWMASASRIRETQPGKWGMDPADPKAKFYIVDNNDGPGSQAYIDWADAVALGADFVDLDGDGIYDPYVDRPDLIGDKTIWCVYNDGTDLSARTPRLQTAPLGLEVHQSVWAFNRGDALGDIIFFRYKLINATDNDINDLIFTNWTDPDLGDPYDDLIACDTTLSLGYIYNFQDDLNYGPNPPAFGIDFFQGPVVETGNPLDTALIKKGPFLGVDTLVGWKNLPMTSFMFYIQSDPVIGDPDLAIVARRYQEGGLDKEGNPLDPTKWGVGGTANTNPRYVFSGDPVTGTGWLDSTPDDKRFMVNTGPFQLAAGDTQIIVVAYVVGRGSDALSSVTKLKEIDVLAQYSYDKNFKAAAPLPRPVVDVRTFEDQAKIEMILDLSPWFAYKNVEDIAGFVNFEGFKIYQFNSVSTEDKVNNQDNAKLIGSFDVNNQYGDLYIETDLGPQRVYIAQNNLDSTLYSDPRSSFFSFTVDKDAFNNNNPLVSFKEYYFTIVPFAINPGIIYPNTITANPNDWIVPGGPLELTRQTGFFAASPSQATTKPFYDIKSREVTYAGPRAYHEGKVLVSTVNQNEVTGHEYEVQFFDNGNYWRLVDMTANAVKLDSFAYQGLDSTEWTYPVVDGMSVRVLNVPDYLESAINDSTETDSVWLTGRSNSGFSTNAVFSNGIDMVKNIQGLSAFSNINLNSQITKDQYFPVKLVFNTTNTSKGYYWNRANPLYLNNFYGGLADIYLEAYDVSNPNNPRKLNIVFNALNGVFNFQNTANTNLIFIMTTDYNENDLYAPTNPNGRNFREDAYLVLNLVLASGANMQSGKQTILVKPYYPNSDVDIFRFSSERLKGELTLDEQKRELDRIKVVPNPYWGYSQYETSYDTPVLKFTHLGREVTIRIFNLAGQLVRTLEKNDDRNEMTWNLRNENNLRVASGMYIAHIQVKGVGEKIIKFGLIQREERLDRF